MNLALTSFDKAIAGAFSTAVLVYSVLAAAGGITLPVELGAAVGAGLVSGLAVYFKSNLPVKP